MGIVSRNTAECGVAALLLSAFLLLSACGQSETTLDEGGINATAFDWQLPSGTPLPLEPDDNPMTEAKFELGRHLFYDARLSANGTRSCSSCHVQALGFADGRVRATGATGQTLARNSQALLNVAYNATLTWANFSLVRLEQQARVPLFGDRPIEHGITETNQIEVLQRLREEARYPALFEDAFPDDADPIHFGNVVDALGSFVRGMVSFDSAFDRYMNGDASALSASAIRGEALFNGEELECFHCHGGYNFSDSTVDRNMTFISRPFHNTGLYNIGGTGDFPADSQGLIELTGDPSDMGKFRAPTLRNIAVTAPYMHDGSMNTLAEVVDFYAAGGRNIESGPYAGDGRFSPFKDGFINGFELSEQEKQDLIAFLESLTDETFNTNPRFSNPWLVPEESAE
jgi:cytochrome c peroxidase